MDWRFAQAAVWAEATAGRVRFRLGNPHSEIVNAQSSFQAKRSGAASIICGDAFVGATIYDDLHPCVYPSSLPYLPIMFAGEGIFWYQGKYRLRCDQALDLSMDLDQGIQNLAPLTFRMGFGIIAS